MMEEELTTCRDNIKELTLLTSGKHKNLQNTGNDVDLSDTYNATTNSSTDNNSFDSTILNESTSANDDHEETGQKKKKINTNNNGKTRKNPNKFYGNNNYDSELENEELENLNRLVSLSNTL